MYSSEAENQMHHLTRCFRRSRRELLGLYRWGCIPKVMALAMLDHMRAAHEDQIAQLVRRELLNEDLPSIYIRKGSDFKRSTDEMKSQYRADLLKASKDGDILSYRTELDPDTLVVVGRSSAKKGTGRERRFSMKTGRSIYEI